MVRAMAARQLWLFLTEADVSALIACLERRNPGVRASFGRYLRGDASELKGDPSRLERRESLPGERRLYLFHERHSADLIVHQQPAGPFAGWSQIDEERSDCLVLHLPDALVSPALEGTPPGDGPLELRPARLQAHIVTWRGAEKARKRPQFTVWAGQAIKALLPIHTPSSVPFMRLGADALARARAGTVRLTYLYRPIGHQPLPRPSPTPAPASAITEENPSLDDAVPAEPSLVILQSRAASLAAPSTAPAARAPSASAAPAAWDAHDGTGDPPAGAGS